MAEMEDWHPSWGAELRNYEQVKRHTVDEGLLRGPQMRVTNGAMKRAERFYDPLLQRYRDNGTEYQQRLQEETERVNHLNRAQDIAIMREQPFDIIRHESKLDAIAPGADPARLGGDNPRRAQGHPGNKHPETFVDYNLVSNLPFDVHHWAPPGRRPRCVEKPAARQRSVPGFEVKDFNVVTNRYLDQHETKSKRDQRLSLLEACHKDAVVNRYNPVIQQYTDPHNEECGRTWDDAHGVELRLRQEAQIPPSFKGRETSFYNMVSHDKHDKEALKVYEQCEKGRKDRYNNRYIMEHNWHAQDIKGDHINNVRKLNKAAPERFEEVARRGYDIVTNKTHGNGPKEQTIYAPYTTARPSVWDQATSAPATPSARSGLGRSRSAPGGDFMASTMPGRFGDTRDSRSSCGRSMRSSASHQSNTRASVYSGRAG